MHKHLIVLAFVVGVSMGLSGSASADNGAAGKPAPQVSKVQQKVHEVVSGDTLSVIASDEGLESWRPLWDANTGLEDPDLIYPGQKLTVPQGPVPERPLPQGVAVAQSPVRPQTQSYHRAVPAGNYSGGDLSALMARVRQRESGGNYAVNTGNGYYGAYQFSLGTWQGVGGSGLPSQASSAEQDMRAQMLYARRGCSPWPNTCY